MKKFLTNFITNLALLGGLLVVVTVAMPELMQPVFEMLLGLFGPGPLLLFALFIALPKRI